MKAENEYSHLVACVLDVSFMKGKGDWCLEVIGATKKNSGLVFTIM